MLFLGLLAILYSLNYGILWFVFVCEFTIYKFATWLLRTQCHIREMTNFNHAKWATLWQFLTVKLKLVCLGITLCKVSWIYMRFINIYRLSCTTSCSTTELKSLRNLISDCRPSWSPQTKTCWTLPNFGKLSASMFVPFVDWSFFPHCCTWKLHVWCHEAFVPQVQQQYFVSI